MSQKKDKEKVLFFKESIFNVARLIFDYPNKTFHIRMIERETKYSPTAIIDATEKLRSFDIIKVEKTPLTTNITANLESEAYRFYKIIFNLYRLERYLFVNGLINIFNKPDVIVLFGSFAKGEDIEESDIDIFVLTKSKPKAGLDNLTKLIEEEMKRKVNLHILPSLEKSSPEFKNAVANGIVLYGYLKVI